MKFAKSDRKKLGINKILPRFKAQKITTYLLNLKFITLEKSHEIKPKPIRKNEKLKKELRRYVVHDKIHFKNNFSRFWFRFIEPNLKDIQNKNYEIVMQKIKDDFDHFCSLGFELLSAKLLCKKLNINGGISSFWNKELEIDLYFKSENLTIVGECKYKQRKICKNVINLLLAKCQKADIKPDFIALFSKNGFSNELLNNKNPQILLFELEDFKALLSS